MRPEDGLKRNDAGDFKEAEDGWGAAFWISCEESVVILDLGRLVPGFGSLDARMKNGIMQK